MGAWKHLKSENCNETVRGKLFKTSNYSLVRRWRTFFFLFSHRLNMNMFTKLFFSISVHSLAPAPKRTLPRFYLPSRCYICPFYEPSFSIFFSSLLFYPFSFFPNPNTEIETVSGLICSLPVHQLPRCLDKFYALCSANIKTVLGSASRSLIKNSLIKSSCKM